MAKIALLIGVSEYEAGFHPLPGTQVDIQNMQRVLESHEIGSFDQVILLPNPSFEDMQIEIDTLFRSPERKSDDLLLLYIAGHGVRDTDGKLYFIARTTRERERQKIMTGSAVSATFIHDCIRNSCVTRQVLILDCCFSGAFADEMTARSLRPIGDEISIQLGGEGRAVLTATTEKQFALEREGAGVYTRYLVEGMETGAADTDRNGVITIAELHEYAKRKVMEAAPAMTPEIYAVREGYSIQLAKAPVGDPRLKYRQEVEAIARRKNGVVDDPIDRRILNWLEKNFGLDPGDAAAIKAEVLQPFEERKQKLQEYQEALQEVVELEGIISKPRWEDLKHLQQILQLRDEDVAALKANVPSVPESEETVPPATPRVPPAPVTENSSFEFKTAKLRLIKILGFFKVTCEIIKSGGRAQYFAEDLGNGTILEMVAIPAGEFLMGSPKNEERQHNSESPQHLVRVPSFFIGKFSVTQAQWAAVAKLPKVKIDLNSDPSHFKGSKRPVEKVSWFEAVEFCDRLSRTTGRFYRLPSEVEWEYACRAGTITPFHFGETIITDLVNFNGNYTYASAPKGKYLQGTTDVGSFPPNAFGLYDMHGNVWEWCLDHWHGNYNGAPTDGSAWLSNDEQAKRLLRGGSWFVHPWGCRSASRIYDAPGLRGFDVGFRCLCLPSRTP